MMILHRYSSFGKLQKYLWTHHRSYLKKQMKMLYIIGLPLRTQIHHLRLRRYPILRMNHLGTTHSGGTYS